MRPIANFALHATLAAVLAAFAATGAAAMPAAFAATAAGPAFIKLGTTQGETARKSTRDEWVKIDGKLMPSAAGDRGGQIEILSWSWGDANAAGPMKPVFVKSWSTSGDAGAPPHRGGGINEMSMDDTAGKEKTAAPTPVVHDLRTNVVARTAPPPGAGGGPYRANDRLRTAGPKDGNAAGGDPDRPVIAGNVPNPSGATRSTYDQPQAKGSVWVRVASPWLGCRVGARYPSLELSGGAKRYVLEDVTVASCGGSRDADDRPTEEVAFYYNKVAS